jgi:uncharacterized protein (DUF433 family)
MIEEYLEEYPVSYLCPRITIKKGRCDGLPCVRGTDVAAKAIAILAEQGLTQDEVFVIYPTLTVEDLIDVHSYYQGPIKMFSHYEKFKLSHPFIN